MMALPPLVLDSHGFTPPYEQIRGQISALIAAGQLHPGASLPSVRQLARDLGVAPNTVMRAYNKLKDEGKVAMTLRRGVVVAARAPTLTEAERQTQLDAAVGQLLTAVRHLGLDARTIHVALDRGLDITRRGEQDVDARATSRATTDAT